MGIGNGKRPIGQNKPKLTEKERDDLQKKQKIEQYIKSLSENSIG